MTLTKRIFHSASCILIFVAAWLGGALLIGHRLPTQQVDSVSDKINWLRKNGEKYDTLFIGSSRTNRHIQADVFDEVMAAAGHPTHSFNLGINAMRPPEDNFVLETVLKKRKTPLKYVFVESNAIRLDAATDPNPDTLRRSYWLDPTRYLVMLRRLQELPSETISQKSDKWGMIVYYTRKFLNRELNLGRGLEIATTYFQKPPKSLKKIYGSNWQGWDLKRKQPPIKQADWEIIQERLADLAKIPAVADFGTMEEQMQMKAKRKIIEAHGAKMIVFTPPLAYRRFTPDPKVTGEIPMLMFGEPSWFPEFYQRQNLADSGHLNAVGASLFSKTFAEQFLKTLQADEAK